jgi:predicted AAA+ superfamily ATPase
LDQISFGRYLENAVGARFVEAGWQTFYWSERDLEVDYVVVGPKNEKWAIEVKSGKNVGNQFKALMTFVKKFPEFKPKVISVNPVDNLPAEIELLDAGEILKLYRS